MGNSSCSCLSSPSPKPGNQGKNSYKPITGKQSNAGLKSDDYNNDSQQSPTNLQHISERDLDETFTPSDHPQPATLFRERAQKNILEQRKNHQHHLSSTSTNTSMHKRVSSCSTIFVDDSTVSQPNIKATIKCVSWGVYYLIKQRKNKDEHMTFPDIFDEKLHPLTKEKVSSSYNVIEPEHRHIYRFIRTLFSSAQLTAECAIVTLVYLERLLTYAEFELCPANWKRIVLGAILLASKVWDDQAVWNVDYCQILKDITVEDMNELERQFLELLQFNINVPSSVYAKYYFDLRSLADENNISLPVEQLSKEKARKLEATSRVCEDKFRTTVNARMQRSLSADHLSVRHNSSVILS